MLVTLEGIDGGGKTTVLDALRERLSDEAVVFTREPTDSWYGDAVYRSIDDDEAELCHRYPAEIVSGEGTILYDKVLLDSEIITREINQWTEFEAETRKFEGNLSGKKSREHLRVVVIDGNETWSAAPYGGDLRRYDPMDTSAWTGYLTNSMGHLKIKIFPSSTNQNRSYTKRKLRAEREFLTTLFDGADTGPRALALAEYIAPATATEVVLLLPPSPGTDPPLREAATELAHDPSGRVRVRELTGREAPALAQTVRQSAPHALVVSRDSPFLAGREGQRLLEELDIPVVVVP